MKRDTNWTDAMRDALREVQQTPPTGGWERLARELGAPAPVPLRRRGAGLWLKIGAAAAAVVCCIFAVEVAWRAVDGPEKVGPKVARADSSAAARATEGRRNGAVADNRPAVPPVTAEPQPGSRTHADMAAVLRERIGLAGQDAQPDTEGRNAASEAEKQPAGNGSERLLAEAVGAEEKTESALSGDSQADGKTELHSDKENRPADGNEVRPGSERATDAHPGPKAVPHVTPYDDFGRGGFVARRPARRTSFGVFAGGGVTAGGGTVARPLNMSSSLIGPGDEAIALRSDYEQSRFRHRQPFGFGLFVGREVARGLSVETGLTWSLLLSEVSMPPMKEEVTQKLHLLGIPLRVNWRFFERGRFSLYIGAGGMAEKCVSAQLGTQTLREPAWQWSVTGAAGAQVWLGGHAGLYVEPECSYYFTRTRLRTVRTDHPLSLTLRLGVRFTF